MLTKTIDNLRANNTYEKLLSKHMSLTPELAYPKHLQYTDLLTLAEETEDYFSSTSSLLPDKSYKKLYQHLKNVILIKLLIQY